VSLEISESFVQQYRDNAVHLAQQMGSRLQDCVRKDPDVQGANYYFEKVGATGVTIITSRGGPTPFISTPQSRRRVTFTTAAWGELINSDDRAKTLIDPESEYMKAAKAAFGRYKDEVIIAAMTGNAFSGKDGQTAVAFPAGQLVADTALNNFSSLDVAANDGGHMSPQRLLKIGRSFALADVDPDEERFIAVGARQIWDDMLQHAVVNSADYNTLKAIAEGAVNSFSGFKFIMSNFMLLAGGTSTDVYGNAVPVITGATAGDRYDVAWARSGIGLAVNEEIKAEVAKDPSRRYAVVPYMETAFGATRIEEARVVVAAVIETA